MKPCLPWLCLDCLALVNLDKHGRCPVCGSDAVTHAVTGQVALPAPGRAFELDELERMWKK